MAGHMKEAKERSLLGGIPRLLMYQVMASVVLGLALNGLHLLASLLLAATGRGAITSGDFTFLFTSWQGWLILLVGIAALVCYLAFDAFGLLILCQDILHPAGESPKRFRTVCAEAFKAVPRFFNPTGVLVLVYIIVFAPLVGIGMTISLTAGFAVPNFIMSVIEKTPLFHVLYIVVMVALTVFGVAHLFALHHVVLGGLTPREALRASRADIKAHWRILLRRCIPHLLIGFGSAVVIAFVFMGLPFGIASTGALGLVGGRYLLIAGVFLGFALEWLIANALAVLLILTFTDVYNADVLDKDVHEITSTRGSKIALGLLCGATAAFILGLSYPLANLFDEFFPAKTDVKIIAHRGGGTLGPENTAEGLIRASEYGVMGSEMDVQRTKDGHYVVNHDNTFERLTGDPRSSSEMTLEEIRKLRIAYTSPDGKKEEAPVTTMEEMLDASKGRVTLYIEFKGETADKKMVDDVVQMVRDRDMGDEVVFICLDYALIDYTKTTYPEYKTGYLYFFSFGEDSGLNCDQMVLEERPASNPLAILALHLAGKDAIVWTVDTPESIKQFLNSDVDAVITDEVEAVKKAEQEMAKRNDFDRLMDRIGF